MTLRHFERPEDLEPFVQEKLHLISAIARQYSARGPKLRIESELPEDRSVFEARILSLCPKDTQDKMDQIVQYVAGKSSYPGDEVMIDIAKDLPLFFCRNERELLFFLGHLESQSVIRSKKSLRTEKALKRSARFVLGSDAAQTNGRSRDRAIAPTHATFGSPKYQDLFIVLVGPGEGPGLGPGAGPGLGPGGKSPAYPGPRGLQSPLI